MCGIAGLVAPGLAAVELEARARAMTVTLAHRGPDGEGIWSDGEAGVALGHRRLAIIDLSEAGRQPMASSCGRMVISYNGEVYNAPELRAELEARGRRFHGHSDTEVLVEGAAEWGIEALLHRLIGMFAVAFWDREARRLTLVRDRFGIKPLYWGRAGDAFVFGSELKALTALPDFARETDRAAVAAYLRLGWVPAPMAIWRAARKLGAGEMLEVEPGGAPVVRPWWRLADLVREARAQPFAGSEEAAAEALEALLLDAVGRRMVADVPLGAFLSGGIDSSTVVALMQAAGRGPVRSFTIGFAAAGYDEATHARAVARHLGTRHEELTATPAEALAVVPELPALYDEPFADASAIPTLLVSRLTRAHVTVALSGDGGDEMFGGYNRHVQRDGAIGRLLGLPAPLRRPLAAVLAAAPAHLWRRLAPGRPLLADKARKLAAALAAGEAGAWEALVSLFPPAVAASLMADGGGAAGAGGDGDPLAANVAEAAALLDDPVERMLYLDALTYMEGDILTKVDRASMACALEVRVPLIDHRVAAFAWSLPRPMRVGRGTGKRILRRVLARHVPPALFERPKQGFTPPIAEWLRGPLRDWAGDLLAPESVARAGLLDPAAVARLWAEHQSGRRDHAARLWALVMLAAQGARG